MSLLKWGILGTGKFATPYDEVLNIIPAQSELLAVGFRKRKTGDAFGDKFNSYVVSLVDN